MDDSPSSLAGPVVVICDRCRAEGVAADPAFTAIPDILAFTPVPRRAHVNNWTADHQRAFIVALAMTGSPAQAARALGRHMFGAQQLRTARGGAAFAEAWDAALEIARDREFARIHANLSDLAARQSDEHAAAAAREVPARALALAAPIAEPPRPPRREGDDDWYSDESRQEYLDARAGIRDRLTRARRLLLSILSADPARRAAWEVLVGPVDWDAADRLEPQADEPFADPADPDPGPPSMARADMILVAEAGMIPDLAGGEDTMARIAAELDRLDQAGGDDEDDAEEDGAP